MPLTRRSDAADLPRARARGGVAVLALASLIGVGLVAQGMFPGGLGDGVSRSSDQVRQLLRRFRGGSPPPQALAAPAAKAPQGVVIRANPPGPYAARAGLRPGDLVRRVNGYTLSNAVDERALEQIIYANRERVEIHYVRGDESLVVRGRL